jgi:hypothetical protein
VRQKVTTDERSICPLVEKWRDRANEEEYKLHREWAIDLCADELAAWLPKVQAVIEAGQALTLGYGHEHWDSTMQHGAGCGRCIEQRKLRAAWDQALADLLGQKKG